jgi:hypothetical protein
MNHMLPPWATVAADIALLVGLALLVNVPFGWFRAGTRRFSLAWFLCIHLPIPLLFLLRHELGLSLWAVPFSLAGAVLGQVFGGRLRARPSAQERAACEGCAGCPLVAALEQP